MKYFRILKSKRGMAIETAIAFMLVIFMLCALLTSLTLIGHYQTKIEKITFLRSVEIDQIGEDYLAGAQKADFTPENFKPENENYDCTATENTLTVWRKSDETKKTVLYVQIDNNGSVICWRYSALSQD